MAFVVEFDLRNYEFRGTQSGVSAKTGKSWLSLVLESEDSRQVSVSVPADLRARVDSLGLCKGMLVDCRVRAVAGKDNSYVMLLDVPVLAGSAVDY